MSRRTTYILLALFLGLFGIHKFYVGKNAQGIIYLLLTTLFCWTFIVPIIIGIIALFDLIVALASTDKEFNERYKVEGENLTDYLLELAKLKTLKDDGTISEDEFETKKKIRDVLKNVCKKIKVCYNSQATKIIV